MAYILRLTCAVWITPTVTLDIFCQRNQEYMVKEFWADGND